MTSSETGERWLSAGTAARVLDCSIRTVHRLRAQGRLRARRRGFASRKPWEFEAESVRRVRAESLEMFHAEQSGKSGKSGNERHPSR